MLRAKENKYVGTGKQRQWFKRIWQHKKISFFPAKSLAMFTAVLPTTNISVQMKKYFVYYLQYFLFAVLVLSRKTEFQPMGSNSIAGLYPFCQ